ncbi:MAG: ABC transporter substrate-binding protein [Oscillospiraceae bacterium]
MKKIIAMLLALAMLFALAACSSSGDNKEQDKPSDNAVTDNAEKNTDNAAENTDKGSEPSGEPIKIGHICDLTGNEALTGMQARDDMDFAVKLINEQGGIAGRPVEVYHKDSQSDAAAASDAARRLVEEDGVCVIFGPTLIGHKGAVAKIAAAIQVPVVFYNPTPEGMIKDNEWVLGASGSTPQMPTVMADYIYNELGYRTVVTLTKDDTGGKSYMDPFTANFEALGGTVVDQRWAPADTTDYSSYLIPLANSGADCLVAWTSASSAIQLWQDWYSMGLSEKLPIVAVMHGAFTDSFICDALTATNPDLVEEMMGTYAPMTWAYNIDSPENEAFVEAWKADHDGSLPIGNNLPGATVQVLQLLKAAVESLDGDTSDLTALRDALKAADVTGPEGRTVFENGSNIATKSVYVVKVVKLDDGSYNYEMVKEYANVPPEGLTVG